MRISEALMERAEVQKRINSLQERLTNVALVQEGDAPVESPEALLDELERAYEEFERIVALINHANLTAVDENGASLTALLAKRDALKKRVIYLETLATTATPKRERYNTERFKFVPSISVPQIRKKLDSAAQELRELERVIQEMNWRYQI